MASRTAENACKFICGEAKKGYRYYCEMMDGLSLEQAERFVAETMPTKEEIEAATEQCTKTVFRTLGNVSDFVGEYSKQSANHADQQIVNRRITQIIQRDLESNTMFLPVTGDTSVLDVQVTLSPCPGTEDDGFIIIDNDDTDSQV